MNVAPSTARVHGNSMMGYALGIIVSQHMEMNSKRPFRDTPRGMALMAKVSTDSFSLVQGERRRGEGSRYYDVELVRSKGRRQQRRYRSRRQAYAVVQCSASKKVVTHTGLSHRAVCSRRCCSSCRSRTMRSRCSRHSTRIGNARDGRRLRRLRRRCARSVSAVLVIADMHRTSMKTTCTPLALEYKPEKQRLTIVDLQPKPVGAPLGVLGVGPGPL